MRTLLAKDIAPFTKIIAKMELKESIKAMFSNNEEGRGQMVSELIWGIIENYYKVEQDFFAFMANLEGKSIEDISNLPLDEFTNLIKELFSEKNMPFFKSAAR
jgi:hypothetical protein